VRDCELFIFSGYVDASRVDEYREAVEVFWDSRASHAVVDLADLAFFGAEGLELVICLGRIARSRGGTVTLIDADGSAVDAIEESGWGDVVRHARWSAPERQPDPQPVRASIPGQRSPEASTAVDGWLGRQSFAVPV
jgi:anti-anti-sigma regulatory factor